MTRERLAFEIVEGGQCGDVRKVSPLEYVEGV